MKKFLGITILFISITAVSQNYCDSTLFYRLFEYSENKKITDKDLKTCNIIIDSLSYQLCDHVLILPDSISTSLSFVYGQICFNADSDLGANSYFKYFIENIGSAEEQLSFSFEKIFTQRPEIILTKISHQDSIIQIALLNSIAWGFINNRQFGVNDPLENVPLKAMTYYDNLPDPVLNSKNYKEIFYSVNPKTKRLYETYKEYYDFVFNSIFEELSYGENNNRNDKNNR
jgi:hypothetical protein